jgi:Dullard-like phosphatase family protein
VKINKEKLLKKSIIIKEYLNKENENYYNDEKTKTDFKMSNKFLSVNLRKKYSDNAIKNKPITYRTLTNFYKKGKTESFNTNDIIIKVNNNRELSYQKGKKLNQNKRVPNNEVINNVKSIKLVNEEQNRNKTPNRNDKKQKKLTKNISKGIPNSDIVNKKSKKNEKNEKKDKSDSGNKNNQNITKGSSSTSNHLYNTYISKNSTNSSFLLNDEIKNLDINTYSENLYFTENSVKKNENEQKMINLNICYTLESKLKILLLKLNNYEICYNETQDWLSYFFGNYFYEKEMEMFDSEQNKKQMIYYINFELICYFMCYDISFNKNYNQVSILLKTIFNLLHKNNLCLISYAIKKINEKNENKDINFINNNNYVEKMIIIKKLQEVIKSELKMNLGQDVNEDVVLEILKDNFKQINNYYNMIIDNIYSNSMEINDKANNISFENNILQKKIIYYKFPECLKINTLKINDKKKLYIISDFFKNALNSIELYNIKEFKYFYNLYLNKSTDNLFIQQFFQNKSLYSLIPCPSYIQSNSEKKILPPINSEKYTYSLVLDLDETLIHLEREYYTFNNIHNIKNKKLTLRPGLINFLEKMKKIYEIILFTFSPNDYADSIIDVIEKDEKYFEHKLYVQHASYNNRKYVKDINDLGRDIKNTIIIEDNINNVHKSNLDNTICIKPFYGECNNEKNTLQLLGNILNKVRYDAEITGDIRKSLAKEKYNIITEISSNLEE